MLDKLLRAPLPEQIVTLLEKLEQNPDTSHLEKVEKLLDYHASNFTRYEEWVIKRQLRKIRNVIRREQTLNNVMSIVINDKTDEDLRMEELRGLHNQQANAYTQQLAKSMQATKNAVSSGLLSQHAQLYNTQAQLIKAHQQAQSMYASEYADALE